MKNILGPYKKYINLETDEKIWYNPETVFLEEENGFIYSVQEVNKYFSESGNFHYLLFHTLYGRNALNFTSRDYDQIKEQIDIDNNDVIIDDFRSRRRVVDDIDLFVVSKDFYIKNSRPL